MPQTRTSGDTRLLCQLTLPNSEGNARKDQGATQIDSRISVSPSPAHLTSAIWTAFSTKSIDKVPMQKPKLPGSSTSVISFYSSDEHLWESCWEKKMHTFIRRREECRTLWKCLSIRSCQQVWIIRAQRLMSGCRFVLRILLAIKSEPIDGKPADIQTRCFSLSSNAPKTAWSPLDVKKAKKSTLETNHSQNAPIKQKIPPARV